MHTNTNPFQMDIAFDFKTKHLEQQQQKQKMRLMERDNSSVLMQVLKSSNGNVCISERTSER